MNAMLIDRFPELEKRITSNYTVKDVYRFVLIRKISLCANARFDADARSEIRVETSYPHSIVECNQLRDLCPKAFHGTQPRTPINHTAVNRALSLLGLKGVLSLDLPIPTHPFSFDSVCLVNAPLYVIGRYNKYSRDISQTPWLTSEGMKKQSLEGLITCSVKKYVPCQGMYVKYFETLYIYVLNLLFFSSFFIIDTRFSASGREDVDVRMLGRGRPFVLELLSPAVLNISDIILQLIEKEVLNLSNGDIQIRDLQLGDKEEVALNLKEGESSKRKKYSAFCICSRELTEQDLQKIHDIVDLVIYQKTPIRVLHRQV